MAALLLFLTALRHCCLNGMHRFLRAWVGSFLWRYVPPRRGCGEPMPLLLWQPLQVFYLIGTYFHRASHTI